MTLAACCAASTGKAAQALQSVTGSTIPGVPVIDATGTYPGSVGIPGVTRTNLTQNQIVRMRNFFLSGGLDLSPTYLNRGGPVIAVPAVASSQPQVQPQPNLLRDGMVREHQRLLAAIQTKRRARLPWTAEAAQAATLHREIQKLDSANRVSR